MMDRFKGKYRIESNRLRGWDYSSDGVYFITIVTAGRACVFGEIQSNQMIYNAFGKIAVAEWHKSFDMRQELFLDEFILMPNHLHAIIVLDGGGKCNNNFDIRGGDVCDFDCGEKRGYDCDDARGFDCNDVRGYDCNDARGFDCNDARGYDCNDACDFDCRDARPCVSTDPNPRPHPGSTPGPDPGSIPGSNMNSNPDPTTDSNTKKLTNIPQPQPSLQRQPKSVSSFVAGYKSAVVNKIDDYIDDNKLKTNKFNRNNPLWQSNYHDHIIRDNESYHKIKNYIINNPGNWREDGLNGQIDD